jgi:hypothetical protein
MAKLLQRLQDSSRSGVYRVAGDVEIADALRGGEPVLHRISLAEAKTKKALLERIAQALQLPDWFGGNWDALEDSLKEKGDRCVFLFDGPPPLAETRALLEVLTAVAEFWKAEGEPFFAVFVDPMATLELPELFRRA